MTHVITDSELLKCTSIIGVNRIERLTTGERIAKVKLWRESFREVWEGVTPIPERDFPVVFIFGGAIADDITKQRNLDADGLAFLSKRCLDAAVLEKVIPDDSPEYISHTITSSLTPKLFAGVHNYILGGAFIANFEIPEFYVFQQDLES